MSKKFDVVATVGEYTNAQGETKKRYQNVGAMVEGQNGPYIVLEAWFNPAAIAKDGRVYLNLYEPKQQGQQQAPQQRQAPQRQQQAAPTNDWDSDPIPF